MNVLNFIEEPLLDPTLDPNDFPHISHYENGIAMIHPVVHVKERFVASDTALGYKRRIPPVDRLYLVFNRLDALKPQCLQTNQLCPIEKWDTIASISITLPFRDSVYVDWVLPLYADIEDYKFVNPVFSMSSMNEESLSKKIKLENNYGIIPYAQFIASPKVKNISRRILDMLSEEALIGPNGLLLNLQI